MTQLDLFYPPVVNVNGLTSNDHQVEYIGKAFYNGNGFYRCLAAIDRYILAIVEVKLTFEGERIANANG